jgi:ATPase MipZ
VRPSIYGEIVWEARKRRFARDRGRVDWIVVRNRLGAAASGCDRARSARCLTGGVAAVSSAALYGAAVFRLPT